MFLNLWNPSRAQLDLLSAFVISYLLGIVHGVTPDEHTWPITFSYSVGSYGIKGGAKAGLTFSSGFTLQRAILSELAWMVLAGVFMTVTVFGITYILVGVAMAAAGLYIARGGNYFHIHFIQEKLEGLFHLHESASKQQDELQHKLNPIDAQKRKDFLKPVPVKLAFVHGLIAGFGFGAFALIIYTVLAPSMPSVYLGFVPGLLFGLGTMTMQVAYGAGFAAWLKHTKHLSQEGIAFLGKGITRYVLTYGGYAFVVAGAAVLAFPNILDYGISTGIKVHNLDNLNIGFFLVVITVGVVGYLGYRRTLNQALKMGLTSGSETIETQSDRH
ncbi:MAG: hypothetical protein QXI37_03040 [Thermoprotei archaeon]